MLSSGAGVAARLNHEGSVVQEDGALSGLYQGFIAALGSAIVNASPRPVWDPVLHQCVRYGVSAPQDPGFPGSGQRGFRGKRQECCAGDNEQPGAGVGGQIPAVPVLSDAVGTNREKMISDERFNTNPLGEEYSSSLSEACLLGEPNQSPGSGGQGGIKLFYI